MRVGVSACGGRAAGMAAASALRLALLLLGVPWLGGCVAAVSEGASVAVDAAQQTPAVRAAALRGDVKAQLQLGEAACCHVSALDIGRSNRRATYWLCKAAAQGSVQARYDLGRIYSGHPILGFAPPMQRVRDAMSGFPSNPPVAMMWLSLAAAEQAVDPRQAAMAQRALRRLRGKSTPEQYAQARRMRVHWRTAPCTWSEVIASTAGH